MSELTPNMAEANEKATAQDGLAAIDELKKTRRGYAYLVERLEQKANEYRDKAIDAKTPEEREVNRLVYKKFKEEIIHMIDIDEENHRRTLGMDQVGVE